MSVSKLESLPNEILADLLEKYINGVDIINAFAFQLNQRFDALIMQSRRFRFDFIGCRKDDFHVCMRVLPAYVDKIEELALADQFTPGQISTFLSTYPSFTMFKNLRKLCLQVDGTAVDSVIFEKALQSLPHIALHTLSLVVSSMVFSNSFENTLKEIFHIKTLRKLSIGDYRIGRWSSCNEGSSNIQYLRIHGTSCASTGLLLHVFQCARDLRYLEIDLDCGEIYNNQELPLSRIDSALSMPMLHTALIDLNFTFRDQRFVNQLKVLFRHMSRLHHLEIRMRDLRFNINDWEAILQTCFPSLISFILEITLLRITEKDASYIMALTKTPFWIENEHFILIIKDELQTNRRRFHPQVSNVLDAHRQNEIVFRWDTNLNSEINDSLSILNRFSKLYLFPECHSSLQNYYLNNVTHLFIGGLDDHLFNYITTHINCSRIQHLDLSLMIGNSFILSLLAYTTNLRSLRINFRQLHDDFSDHSRIYEHIQSLDLSAELHIFIYEDIFLISKIFPQLQHLIIFTEDMRNVPMLETYLPRLRHFTFCCTKSKSMDLHDVDENKTFADSLRRKAEFLFNRNGAWITIWIDQAALRDSYWHKTVKTDHSKNFLKDSLMRRTINKISSLFK